MEFSTDGWLEEFLLSSKPEQTVCSHFLKAIYNQRPCRPEPLSGRPFRVLLLGYCGAGNTGADVRSSEIVRQLRSVLDSVDLAFTMTVIGEHLPYRLFPDVAILRLGAYPPADLVQQVLRHDLILVCEGSVFTSAFSNIFAAILVGSLGLGSAHHRASVGYGSEADRMDPILAEFVKEACHHSFVICRNEASRKVVDALGIRTALGADTAYTFQPHPPADVTELLHSMGWNGKAELVAVCPVNPFWWPVRPDLHKTHALQKHGRFGESHYGSIFFHSNSPESTRLFEDYLDRISYSLRHYCSQYGAFPIVIGMERLDQDACRRLAAHFGKDIPIITPNSHDPDTIVALLRRSGMIISSRYHAIVCALPAEVRCIGISTDSRIRHLMENMGTPDLLLDAADPELGDKLLSKMRDLRLDRGRVVQAASHMVTTQLQRLQQMGGYLLDEVRRVFPDYPSNRSRP